GGRTGKQHHCRRRSERLGKAGRSACSAGQQSDEGLVIDLGEQIQIAGQHALINLVDGGVYRTKFYHLSAQRGDKAPVGRAAAGGGRGFATGDLADAGGYRVEQLARLGEKRQAGQCPVDVPVQAVLVEDGGNALLE